MAWTGPSAKKPSPGMPGHAGALDPVMPQNLTSFQARGSLPAVISALALSTAFRMAGVKTFPTLSLYLKMKPLLAKLSGMF